MSNICDGTTNVPKLRESKAYCEGRAAAAGGAGAVALAVGAPLVWGALCGAVQGALTRRGRRRS